MPKPRIFISHSENNRGPTDFTIKILHYLGCIPVIAEDLPRSNFSVPALVADTMDSCDAVIVIATPDTGDKDAKNPSQGVLIEIGQLQKSEKFQGKYFIIKEESVALSPMIPESRYKFSDNNYGPIAEAIIIELTSMGFLKNYYELKGSDLKIHELMETLDQLRELANKNVFEKNRFREYVEKVIRDTVEKIIGG